MNQVIEIRIDTLLLALDDVIDVVKYWQELRRNAKELALTLANLEDYMQDATSAFKDFRIWGDIDDDKLVVEADGHLQRLQEAMGLMRDNIETALHAGQALSNSYERISDEKLRWTMGRGIVKKAKELRAKVRKLRKRAQEADNNDIGDIWSELTGQVDDECAQLFSVFNDTLGGLALRVAGLDGLALRRHQTGDARATDHSISWMAETLATNRWRGIAVPTAGRSLTENLTPTLQLSFPQWTLWDLPYSAHAWARELLTDVIRGDPGMAEAAKRLEKENLNQVEDRYLPTFLADVTATYVMGPSYACAALYLQLNPWADHDTTPDHERAWIVQQALRKMSQGSKKGAPTFTSTADKLWTSWVDSRPGREADLPRDYQNELNAVCTTIIDRVEQSPIDAFSRYPLDSWQRVAEWCDGIAKNEHPRVDTLDIRDVLNFAWRCRLDNCADDLATIETEAMTLWAIASSLQTTQLVDRARSEDDRLLRLLNQRI